MYFAGFTQGQMWKEFLADGRVAYEFIETVHQIVPMYGARAIGGTIYIIGAVVMLVNLVKTIKAGSFVEEEEASAPALAVTEAHTTHGGHEYWHRWIERRPVQLAILSLVAILIGGAIEMIPTFLVKENVPTISSVEPYTPLELQGRDVYIQEGCYNCHSQMVRPFRDEVARYGEYSKAGEFVYDHPFQWGSKRTGPDLAREGGYSRIRKSDSWHYEHLIDPITKSEGSIMPRYEWLQEYELDIESTPAKISAMRTLGVPYEEGYEDKAIAYLHAQADQIASNIAVEMSAPQLKDQLKDKEIVALIAYLQRLGSDIYKTEEK